MATASLHVRLHHCHDLQTRHQPESFWYWTTRSDSLQVEGNHGAGIIVTAAYRQVYDCVNCRLTAQRTGSAPNHCSYLRSAMGHRGTTPKFLGGPNPSLHLLSPPLLSLYFSFPSSSTSRPFPVLRLEVGPLNTAREPGRTLKAPHCGVGDQGRPQRKANLVHFILKIWHLMAPSLLIFLRINEHTGQLLVEPNALWPTQPKFWDPAATPCYGTCTSLGMRPPFWSESRLTA